MPKEFFEKNDGASAVEFALLAPIFIMLFIGTFDIGLLVTDQIKVQNIAHSVAEYAAKAQDDTDIETVAQEMHGDDFHTVALASGFECECGNGIALTCPLTCETDGDYQRRYVTITATKTFVPLFPYPTMYTDNVILQSTVRMRVD